MFIKAHTRTKDGKVHCYYSLVESVRTARGPQHRTLAYLGELNVSAEAAWRKSIAVFNGDGSTHQLELFASDAPELPTGERVVQVVLDRVRWERPRDFGEIYLAHHLWRLLDLEDLLAERMAGGEPQMAWHVMGFILTAVRLLAPCSELAIEQTFYPRTALDDVVGVPADKVNKDRLYRTLDRLARSCGVNLSARRILAAVSTIKSGDVVLPLVDGRELRLRRVSRPDADQAQLLARLGIGLPERVGVDSMTGPM